MGKGDEREYRYIYKDFCKAGETQQDDFQHWEKIIFLICIFSVMLKSNSRVGFL